MAKGTALDRMTSAKIELEMKFAKQSGHVLACERALRMLKVRIAYMGHPAEKFWDCNGKMVPDWRGEIHAIELALYPPTQSDRETAK